MRQIISLAGKLAISAGLLYLAVGRTNFSIVGERLSRLDMTWLVVAFAISLFQVALLAFRWSRITRQCDALLPLPRALRMTTIATFFNQVLPSTVGGDAVRVWLLAREGAGWSKATYSVLLDRFVGVLVLALLVIVCLPWSLELVTNPIGRVALLVIGFGSIGGAAAFLALGFVRLDFFRHWWPTRHLMQLSAIARKLLTPGANAAVLLAVSVAIHALTAAVAWCAARAVAAPLEFVHALLLVCPVMLIATIPVSIAGWGVRESALMLAFSYAGLLESDGLVVSVLLGIVLFAVGLVGGVVWLASAEPLRVFGRLQDDKPPSAA